MSELSNRLAELRRRAGKSEVDIAKAIGLDKSFIRDFENGFRIPLNGALKSLARVYNDDYRVLFRLASKARENVVFKGL